MTTTILRWLHAHPTIAVGGCLLVVAFGLATAIDDLRHVFGQAGDD